MWPLRIFTSTPAAPPEPQLPTPTPSRKSSVREEQEDGDRSRSRRRRTGFYDSVSAQDLTTLCEEENAVDISPRGVLDGGGSSSTTSMESSSMESINNAGAVATTTDCDPPAVAACTSISSSSSSNKGGGGSNSTKWHGFIRNLTKSPPAKFYTIPLMSVPKLTRRKSRRIRGDFIPPPILNMNSSTSYNLETELCCFKKPSWKTFSLSELKDATNNFSQENLIGEGGCSEVYKGQLPDGKLVAVKRLTKGEAEEMAADFLSELGIIVHIDHRNIAKLIGYGVEGGMHIVLHLSPHGSLASILYTAAEKLDWTIRYKVALGTSRGLMYLHKECQRRIIHKDVKAANILLAEDYEPLIADFGMAKWLPEQWSHHIVSQIEGTFGYLPPEYFMHGFVDEKTDVYAYGVLLLELITGRKALDDSQQSIVMWARPLLVKSNVEELVDRCLGGNYDHDQMDRIILAAKMCINQSSAQRPEMSEVVRILEGDEGSFKRATSRQKSTLVRTYSEELYSADDYNSTKYLSDMDQYMQMIMDQSDGDDDEQEKHKDIDPDHSSSDYNNNDIHQLECVPPNDQQQQEEEQGHSSSSSA